MPHFQRNPHLIYQALKTLIRASLLTLVIDQFNVTVGGIMVANLIGPNALSCIQLFTTIENATFALYTLFGSGALLLVSEYIGERNYPKLHKTLATSFLCLVGLFLLFAVFTWVGDPAWWVDLFCKEAELRSGFQDYALVRMTYMGSYFFMFWTNGLTLISGKPKRVVLPITVAAVANVVLTYVFIVWCHWDMVGAAYATVVSIALNGLLLLPYLYKEFKPAFQKLWTHISWNAFKENFVYGYPVGFASLGTMCLYFFMNLIMQNTQGTHGMFVWAVVVSLYETGLLIIEPVTGATTAIGPFLRAQRDAQGVRYLVRIGAWVVGLLSIVLILFVGLGTGLVAHLFGAHDPVLLAYTVKALKTVLPFLPVAFMVVYLSETYLMLGFERLSSLTMALLPVGLISSTWGCAKVLGPDRVWYGYPLAAFVLFLALCILSRVFRHKHKDLAPLTLAPRQALVNSFDVSMQANEQIFEKALQDVYTYLKSINIDKAIALRVNLCLEEMMRVIVYKAQRAQNRHTFDVFISIDATQLVASLKDSGSPFNPILETEESQKMELKIIRGMCGKMEYKYMHGQNMTYLTWDLPVHQ